MYLILRFVLGIIIQYYYGRLAQLVEHLLDVQRVSGSIPLSSTRGAVPAIVGAAFFCPFFRLYRDPKQLAWGPFFIIYWIDKSLYRPLPPMPFPRTKAYLCIYSSLHMHNIHSKMYKIGVLAKQAGISKEYCCSFSPF